MFLIIAILIAAASAAAAEAEVARQNAEAQQHAAQEAADADNLPGSDHIEIPPGCVAAILPIIINILRSLPRRFGLRRFLILGALVSLAFLVADFVLPDPLEWRQIPTATSPAATIDLEIAPVPSLKFTDALVSTATVTATATSTPYVSPTRRPKGTMCSQIVSDSVCNSTAGCTYNYTLKQCQKK